MFLSALRCSKFLNLRLIPLTRDPFYVTIFVCTRVGHIRGGLLYIQLTSLICGLLESEPVQEQLASCLAFAIVRCGTRAL